MTTALESVSQRVQAQHRTLDRAAWLLALLLLVFAVGFSWQSWQQAKTGLMRELAISAELSERAVDTHFQQLQIALQDLAQEIQHEPVRFDLPRIRRFKALHPELIDVLLVRPDGQVLLSTLLPPGTPLPSLSTKPLFNETVQGMLKGQWLFCDRPVLGTLTLNWMLPLRMPVLDARGQLKAVLSAYLPMTVLEDFWRDTPLVERGSMGLLGDDGYLRSRLPLPRQQNLDEVYGAPRSGLLSHALKERGWPVTGHLEGFSRMARQDSVGVFQRLKHFPLTLFITLPRSELRALWWRNTEPTYFLLAMLTIGLLFVYRETSRRQQILSEEQELSRSVQNRLAAIVESSDDAILSKTLDGVILSWNPGATRLLGYREEETLGQNMDLIVPAEHRGEDQRYLERVRQGNRVERIETQRLHRDGRRIDVEMSISPLCDPQGRVTGISHIMRNISARKKAQQAIHVLAYFDALTGLPNRRQLIDRLGLALASVHHGHQQMGALMFVDLDHFKDINDARGHATGDEVLRHVAAALVRLVDEGDAVARLGGDEFVLLATSLGQDQDSAAAMALGLAERARQLLAEPFELSGQRYTLSASIGVSLFPLGHQTADDLLREADTAMYRAKTMGRNRVAFFEDGMQADIEDRLALEYDLSRALALQQLEVHLQSQFNDQGGVDGAELLLRWNHPQKGLVGPDRFIPLAEKSGLILGLGQWVLQQACALSCRLEALGRPLPLSINVSPRQFRQPDFVDQVLQALKNSGAQANRLIFEVTEGLLIDDFEETVARMLELARWGIRFSIDDFGTGYSSLAYLKRLPLYELKIDRSFVKDTPEDSNDTAIVRLILSMADHLGLRVVAEGVETREQADFLISHGCDALQGYLLARPMPMPQWLAQLEDAASVASPTLR